MSVHAALTHRTVYRYDRPVGLGPQTIRLRPAPHARTPILAYSLKITPEPHFLNWMQDPAGNFLARAVFPDKVREFSFTVDLVADMGVINPFDFFLEPQAEQVPVTYDPILAEELAPYRRLGRLTPKLEKLVASIDMKPRRTVDFLVDLNQQLAGMVRYIIRMEPGVLTPEQTLERGEGSCRDSGWLLVQILRHLGFAARFVSGYLIQLKPDVKPLDGPEGPQADFTDLHAWAEVYLPGAGWVGLDPTSGLLAGEGHIPLAATPEPGSAAPVTGAVDEAEVDFTFEMDVVRVRETPRVTLPYARETWAEIDRLGAEVDRRLDALDVRLTMGGEPTFVSIDDMQGEEWTVGALGPTKRRLGDELLGRLADRFASGYVLHHGQGKWYPGESLPRWALSCLWRRDGIPVWRDRALLATEQGSDPKLVGEGGVQAARLFAATLAAELAVDPEHVTDGHEDVWWHLWKERRLPANIDPFTHDLSDDEERARLARNLERDLRSVTGVALPLARAVDEDGKPVWASGAWSFRTERMYLIPGDNPMGYRLPLPSLPFVSEADTPWHFEDDPLAAGPLPGAMGGGRPGQPFLRGGPTPLPEGSVPGGSGGQPSEADLRAAGIVDGVVRTALCVEPREGRLYVFLPPMRSAADYLELIAAVEATAARLGQPVVIEGYKPPAHPDLNSFEITPDPGVIEVNIHPSHSWAELARRTRTLYDEARQTRLGAEKFMLDGRHVGTGGGNHLVLGGASPGDSPFLRRPDLLRSLVGFFHNHPSLSYLFSGLFIGPTSQHPRVDEARTDQTHELEIAFRQLDAVADPPPWLVDRIFRNLLVDVTGNTHRAEFCIDKLYSPDTSAGRRGLVELRAFEMPPHPEMSLAQQLLVRAMIAAFWERPYDDAPVRWGTRLQDEFLLPHFVERDFEDAITILNRRGMALDARWFRPHHEFRFPEIGTISVRDTTLELRQALEPWHVLGEEPGTGGTVRYVDNALDRVQVKAQGWNAARHVLVCNGRAVPLRPTGTSGEAVAGIRYKAVRLPRGLHPTVPLHAPLVFDLHDRWTGRALGGCTYHAEHPGGVNPSTYPVNAHEAEARRRARFFAIGHRPGRMPEPLPQPSVDMPTTLDLRHS